MNRLTLAVTIACAVTTATPAHADYDEYAAQAEVAAKIAAKITFATVNRVRRSIALGPHAGSYVGSSFGPGNELASGITFGLALYTFDIPSILDIDKMIKAEAERAVKAEIQRVLAEGGTPDMKAIALAAYDNVKDDIMGPIRPHTLEKPKLGVIVEGMAQLEPGGAIGARASFTKGVGPVSIGVAGSILRGSGNTIGYLGPDVSLRLTPWGKSWTPVIDLYLRFDVGFDDGERPYLITLGGRMLLDLI